MTFDISTIDLILISVVAIAVGIAIKLFCDKRDINHDRRTLSEANGKLTRANETLAQTANGREKELAKLKKEHQASAKARIALTGLTNPSLLVFPPGTPQQLHERTIEYANRMLHRPTQTLVELISRDAFNQVGIWELYWGFVYATQEKQAKVDISSENGISSSLIDGLTKYSQRLAEVDPEYRSSLNIAHCKLYDQIRPGMKEEDAGADLLLVVASDRFASGGGARLIWLQAKRIGATYTAECKQENNGGYQIDALQNANHPDKGSFGVYAKFSAKLPFMPAFALKDYVPPKPHLTVDLGAHGVRLPELLAVLATAPDYGQFADTQAIIAFLDSIALDAPVLLSCITVASPNGAGSWNANDLLNELTQYYDDKLGLKPEPVQHPFLPTSGEEEDQEAGNKHQPHNSF